MTAVLLSFLACTPPGKDAVADDVTDTADTDPTGDTDPVAPPCADGRFSAEALPWLIPTPYVDAPFESVASSSGWDGALWVLEDLTGDGRPDLVVTSGSASSGVSPDGSTAWHVYPNTGVGFAGEPLTWALPDYDYFPSFARYAAEDDFEPFVVRDMDGDRRPDLVVTAANIDEVEDQSDPEPGDTVWYVHRNTGTGFEATPTEWPLPSGYGSDAFRQPEYFHSAAVHFLRDLTGDGRDDLLVTSVDLDGDEDYDPVGGVDSWDVYANTGAGFDPTPLAWSVPSANGPYLFAYMDWGGADDPRHTTVDLTGDDAADLVTLYVPDGAVGTTEWVVYPAGASGFGAPVTWSLPAFDEDAHYEELSYEYNPVSRRVVDFTNDGAPDLVIMRTEDEALGHERWDVHPNEGAGFGAAVAWELPFVDERLTFWNSEDDNWATRDLDGDGLHDFVVTTPLQGEGQWLVYLGVCD